jgi:hypothetical protein
VPVRGVPQEAHHRVAIGSLTNWDAARVFLEVVRCGNFRSAAEGLELSINAVRRRIDAFERQVGHPVHARRPWHPPDRRLAGCFGSRTYNVSRAASFDLLRAGNSITKTRWGEVRVAITEGLGTFGWPLALSSSSNRSRTFLSISTVRCAPPTYRGMRPTLRSICRGPPRLCQTSPARQTFDVFCQPKIHRDLRRPQGPLTNWSAPVRDAGRRQTAAKGAFETLFPGSFPRDLLVMKTKVSSANYWSVADGTGIGVFPTYTCAFGGKIIPLEIELR